MNICNYEKDGIDCRDHDCKDYHFMTLLKIHNNILNPFLSELMNINLNSIYNDENM